MHFTYILKLRALDPIDADPGAAEFGNFIHKAMELFITGYDARYGLEDLLQYGHEIIGTITKSPAVKMLWMPRFKQDHQWFVAYEAQRRMEEHYTVLTETKGQMDFGNFILTAKADRIDVMDGERLCIVRL